MSITDMERIVLNMAAVRMPWGTAEWVNEALASLKERGLIVAACRENATYELETTVIPTENGWRALNDQLPYEYGTIDEEFARIRERHRANIEALKKPLSG